MFLLIRYPDQQPDPMQGEGGLSDKVEKEALELVNEFFYGVRIFPGQVGNEKNCARKKTQIILPCRKDTGI